MNIKDFKSIEELLDWIFEDDDEDGDKDIDLKGYVKLFGC